MINAPEKLDMLAMRHAATTQASGLLKALGNPDRLLLLCQLSLFVWRDVDRPFYRDAASLGKGVNRFAGCRNGRRAERWA